MKALAITSAAALFALASLAQADAVHADGGVNADAGYEEVNPKVGRMPILDPQPNAREYEAEVNPKIGLLPVLTPTRASNDGWLEVNSKQGRIPTLDGGTRDRELAGF